MVGIFQENIFQNSVFDTGVNPDRRANAVLTPFRKINVGWWFTNSQLEYFNEWLEYAARHEAAFFSIDVPIESSTYRTVKARFFEPPKISYVAEDLWLCTAILEVRDTNLVTPGGLDVFEEFGEDMLDMLDAIDDLTLDPFFDAWDALP